MIKLQGFGRGLTEITSRYLPAWCEESTKISQSATVGTPAEVRTEHLQNTILYYDYTSMLGIINKIIMETIKTIIILTIRPYKVIRKEYEFF